MLHRSHVALRLKEVEIIVVLAEGPADPGLLLPVLMLVSWVDTDFQVKVRLSILLFPIREHLRLGFLNNLNGFVLEQVSVQFIRIPNRKFAQMLSFLGLVVNHGRLRILVYYPQRLAVLEDCLFVGSVFGHVWGLDVLHGASHGLTYSTIQLLQRSLRSRPNNLRWCLDF